MSIIGNPPFMGAKMLKPERGPDYVNAVRHAYPGRAGHGRLLRLLVSQGARPPAACTAADPVAGRAGLVGTQNIRNNQSRVGGLDYIARTGTIVEAVDNQPWSGEANVHVSIANWVKSHDPAVLPEKRRLWQRVDPSLLLFEGKAEKRGRKATETPGKRRGTRKDKSFELAYRDCAEINAALSDQTDVTMARTLRCNSDNGWVCQGVTPGHSGFLLSRSQRHDLLASDPTSAGVIFPYLVGRELLSGDGKPDRFVIDFGNMSILDAQACRAVFAHVQKNVLPDVQRKARDEHVTESAHKDHIQRWWLHWRPRSGLIASISKLQRFLVCSRVTKRPIFVFVEIAIRPGDAVQVFAFPDDYSFGILQAHAHWLWFITKCSKLTERFRYTPPSVFETFPWPQSPANAQIDAAATAGREVRRVRTEALAKVRGGLRAVYRTLELPGKNPLKDAHAASTPPCWRPMVFRPRKTFSVNCLT